MSQSSTPHNAPAGQPHRSGNNTPKESKNLNSVVTDSTAANSRQLLNAYVYDFLIKSSLPNTAKAFYQEADIPISSNSNANNQNSQQQQQQNVSSNNTSDADLPPLSISMDAPQGFLYEWWQIFWDVFNARTHRVGSAAAQQYFQLHLLRQRQEHALHGMTALAAQAQQQQQMQQQQQQQQQQQMQQQQQHQQVGVPAGSPNNMSPQLMGKRPANMNSVARLQQEHAQRQMNNLRQQQLVQLQQLGNTPINGQQTISIQSPSKRMRIENTDHHSNGNTPTHVHNLPSNSGQSPHNLPNQIPPQGMMIPNQFNPQLAAAMFAQQQKQLTPQQQMAGAAAFQQSQQLVPNKQQMMFNQLQQQQQRIPGEFFNNGFSAANMPMQSRPPQQQHQQQQPPPPPQQQQQGPNGPIKTPQLPPQQFRQQLQPQHQQHQQPQQQLQHQSPSAAGPHANSQQNVLLQNDNANINSDNSLQARNSLLGLQDYQMQLILIERNNKKKMEDVRNIDVKNESGNGAQQLMNSEFNNMFNGQLQQQLQAQGKWNGTGNDNTTTSMPPPQLSRGTPVSSPAITNPPGSSKIASNSAAPTSNTKKKAVPKTRKKKGAANNTSEPATPTTPATPAAAASAPTPHSATTVTNGSKRGAKRKESIRDSVSSDVAPTAVKKEDQTTTTASLAQGTTTSSNIDISPHANATLNNTGNNSNEVDPNILSDYQQFNADTFGASADSNFLSDFNSGSRGDDMALDLNVFLDTDGEVNNGSFMFNWGNVTES